MTVRAMRRGLGVGVTLLTLAAAVTLAAQGPLAGLGVTDGQGKDALFESLLLGAPRMPKMSGAFAAASDSTRVAMVQAACSAARGFTESQEFLSRYADHREANGPGREPTAPTIEEVLVSQRKAFEEQVVQMKTQLTDLTPAQVKTLEEGWADVRQRMTDMETGPRRAELEALIKQRRAQQMRAYEAAVKEHNDRWPQTGRALVAIRLKEFLEATGDVNHAAATTTRDSLRVFTDAALEARPAVWKLLFRAGKPASDAARDCATQWLASMPAGPA